MRERIWEISKCLYGCFIIEKETSLLYSKATRKLPYPKLSIATTAIACDNQKHATAIGELLKSLLYIPIKPNELSEEFRIGFAKVRGLIEKLETRGYAENEEIDELIRNLVDIEDYRSDLFEKLIDSELNRDYSIDSLDERQLAEENFKHILQVLKQDNSKHRDMLIESLYTYKVNLLKNKDTTPIVRFQNPTAWGHP